MPELPEVETTRRGIVPYVVNKKVRRVIIRNGSLRWPVPDELPDLITGRILRDVGRRGKYLLLEFSNGTVLWHLGMSGSLRIIQDNRIPAAHDHLDVEFTSGIILRYNDPRRFGTVLWTDEGAHTHKLISHLGPEPLSTNFNGDYLFARSRKRTQAVKTWIMDSQVVVGVGNIYANESLFLAGIHPLRKAATLTRRQCDILADEIKKVLAYAIELGGTTLRDFVGSDGKPGYFAQELCVYGRGAHPCIKCAKPLTEKRIGQRTTVYCIRCQT